MHRKETPSDGEDPLFWMAVEALLYGGGRPISEAWRLALPIAVAPAAGAASGVPVPADVLTADAGALGKRLRSARCGVCPGCNSGDCGECKNCLDKPRFGGPGCRKQACMMRTCSMPRVVDERDLNYTSDGSSDEHPPQQAAATSARATPNEPSTREVLTHEGSPLLQPGLISPALEAIQPRPHERPLPESRQTPMLAAPVLAAREQTPMVVGDKARVDLAAQTIYGMTVFGRTISEEAAA